MKKTFFGIEHFLFQKSSHRFFLKSCQGIDIGLNYQHTGGFFKQISARFGENSQFVDFMSSLYRCYGSGDVNKTYCKIRFNIRYVVLLRGFSVNALQPKLWSIKHKGVRPLKMVASLLKPSFEHFNFLISLSIRPSEGASGEEVLDGGGEEGGEEKGRPDTKPFSKWCDTSKIWMWQ